MPSIPGECLEISGITSSVSDNDLEDVVCKAITKAGMSDKHIEDCHRVDKRGTTIVKFCKRKVSKQVLNARNNLTKLLMEDLNCWCPYYRVLWSKSKSLHRMVKIFLYYVSNGNMKIEIQQTSQPLSIMHTSDLENFFLDVDLGPTLWWWDCFALLWPERNLWSLLRLGWTSLWWYLSAGSS